MIIRMKNEFKLACLNGFLYNVNGAKNIQIMFSTGNDFSIELRMNFRELCEDYPNCVEEAMACLIGEITSGVEAAQIESISMETFADRVYLNRVLRVLEPRMKPFWKREWVRVVEWDIEWNS